jgi:hypothetical protein
MRLDDGLRRAKGILEQNLNVLCGMSKDLARARSLTGEELEAWIDQVCVMGAPEFSQRLTTEMLIEKLENCKLKFRFKSGTYEARMIAKSPERALMALTRIGWKYGERHVLPSGDPDLLTTVAEGLDAISSMLPENSIITVSKMHDFSVYLCKGAGFRLLNEHIETGEALKFLRSFSRNAERMMKA